ncbi:protein of unknown function [Burkholderia multivorans]
MAAAALRPGGIDGWRGDAVRAGQASPRRPGRGGGRKFSRRGRYGAARPDSPPGAIVSLDDVTMARVRAADKQGNGWGGPAQHRTGVSLAAGQAEHFGCGDHRGGIGGGRALGRAEHLVPALDHLARQRAGAGALREAAAPALLAVVTAAGFDPADDEQRVGAFENFDVDVVRIEHRHGFGGHHLPFPKPRSVSLQAVAATV